MYSACDNTHYSVTYETLKPPLISPDSASDVGYSCSKPEIVPLPIGGVPGKMATVNGGNTTTPNICIEDGRIEFVKSPIDCGDEKQDHLKVSIESANAHYYNISGTLKGRKISEHGVSSIDIILRIQVILRG